VDEDETTANLRAWLDLVVPGWDAKPQVRPATSPGMFALVAAEPPVRQFPPDYVGCFFHRPCERQEEADPLAF
jgi:hypothetical protein